MATSYLDLNGLEYLWGKVKERDAEDIDAGGVETTVVTGNPLEITSPYVQTAKDLTIDIEPIQDLHGYTKPWVGGAGKNKYKMRTSSITQNGITVIANSDGTLNISGTATETTRIELSSNISELTNLLNKGGTFILSLHNATYDNSKFNVSIMCTDNGTNKWFIPTYPQDILSGEHTVTSILYVESGVTVNTVTNFAMQFEISSSATSFEPYSNICPIYPGNGKNLLPIFADTSTTSGVTFTIKDDGTVVANGTASGNATKILHWTDIDNGLLWDQIAGKSIILTGCPQGGSTSTYKLQLWMQNESSYPIDIGNGVTFTMPESSSNWNVAIVIYSGVTVNNLVFKPMIRLASEPDSTFVPYLGIGVHRLGKNLIDVFSRSFVNTVASQTVNTILTEGSTASFNGSDIISITNGSWSKLRFKMQGLKHGKTYTFSAYINNPSGNVVGVGYFASGEWTSYFVEDTDFIAKITFIYDSTFDASDFILAVITNNSASARNTTVTVNKIQLELGSEVTDYELYNSFSVAIPLGQTVYGGTLDVKNGELTVNRAIVDLGSLTSSWNRLDTNETGKYRFRNPSLSEVIQKPDSLNTVANITCSALSTIAGNDPINNISGIAIHTNGHILIYSEAYSTMTEEEFNNAISGVQLCYELATPPIYTLTPKQLELLKGYNCITTTGESSTLTYDGIKDTSVQEELFKLNKNNEEFKNVHSEIKDRIAKVYAFHIDGAVSDPATKVTYLEDAKGMTPAHMDYTNGVFDYGSWDNAFFMPRPCMLSYDSKVDYYLDPNDYSKKEDGTASDIANTSYSGNAMMEWGQNGKKIWYKVVPDQADVTSGTVYISDTRIDDTYHAWSFINNQGFEVDHFYTPIYNGSSVNDGSSDVMRSMSGLAVSQSLTGTVERTRCLANNKSSDVLWYTEVMADRILINFLLILIGKSTDTQTVFGNGLIAGAQTALNNYQTGALNDKGLFFGYSDQTHAVKVFGMENYWGAQWRRHAGYILKNGDQRVKLTYGQQDGSTVDGYNTDGSGYISMGITPTGTSSGYIDVMNFNEYGMFEKNSSGSYSTHYCDGQWFNNSGNRYALFGGSPGNGVPCGAFYCDLSLAVSSVGWYCGVALSCKPKAKDLADNLAPTETSVATTNHAIGDYIMFDGQFCKVTGTIVAGDTVTVGTNVVKTTLGAELLSILAQIS